MSSDRERFNARRWVMAAWLLAMASGCGASEELLTEHAQPDTTSQDNTLAERLAQFEARLPEIAAEQTAVEPSSPAQTLDTLKDNLHNPDALTALYKEGPALWTTGAGLSPAGDEVFQRVTSAHADGLNPEDYHVATLHKLHATLTAAESTTAASTSESEPPPEADDPGRAAGQEAPTPQDHHPPKLNDAHREALLKTLRTLPVEASQASVEEALWAALTRLNAESTQRDALAQWVERREAHAATAAEASAALEIWLTDGLLRYARDMRLFNLHGTSEDTIAAQGGREAVIDARTRDFLKRAAASHGDAAKVSQLLAELTPPTPRYAPLQAALTRYEAIVAAGGWPTEMPYFPKPRKDNITRYRAGLKRYPDKAVSLMKARLAGERLYEGPIDERWDEALTAAVRRYRRNNLLNEGSYIDYEMIQAMKVPAEYRLAQIKLNLQRLRETRLGHDDYYIYVNVPEYFAEVWDQGELKLRFKVIVGSRKKWHKKDRRRAKWWIEFQDATPLLSARMNTVVFNPFWTVPARIRAQLKRQAKDDPDFWKDNGYEVQPYGNGEIIRQKPGPNNALGQVKFLFPNPDDIYMHDTPRRGLFREVVRAYSHGCMRVHEPLKLAQHLLQREDDAWSKRRVQISAGSGTRARVGLKDGPMVHTDYVTVTTTEEGDVQFLWDIYHRDIAAIKEREGLEGQWGPHYP